MLGYINDKLDYGSTCIELPTESTEMSPREVIHCSDNVCISSSEIDPP